MHKGVGIIWENRDILNIGECKGKRETTEINILFGNKYLIFSFLYGIYSIDYARKGVGIFSLFER